MQIVQTTFSQKSYLTIIIIAVLCPVAAALAPCELKWRPCVRNRNKVSI